jgi:anti-sigma factor RsiW
MTSPLDHEEIQSLLGAFALDAVDPDEARAVEEHLATCPRCRAEVDTYVEVAGALGNSVEPVPGQLWDRIALGVQTSGRGPVREELEATDLARIVTGNDELAEARRRRAKAASSLRQRALVVVASAAAVLAVVFGLQLGSANHNLDSTRAALAAKGDGAAVTAALQTPGHQVVDLRSTRGVRLARFVLLPDGQGYLVSSSLSRLPRDETYQLWGKIEGQPISLALLGNDPSRGGFTVASATPSTLMVTIEPSGGVTTPDRAPLASGNVTRA